jgi:hypothetical protein
VKAETKGVCATQKHYQQLYGLFNKREAIYKKEYFIPKTVPYTINIVSDDPLCYLVCKDWKVILMIYILHVLPARPSSSSVAETPS